MDQIAIYYKVSEMMKRRPCESLFNAATRIEDRMRRRRTGQQPREEAKRAAVAVLSINGRRGDDAWSVLAGIVQTP